MGGPESAGTSPGASAPPGRSAAGLLVYAILSLLVGLPVAWALLRERPPAEPAPPAFSYTPPRLLPSLVTVAPGVHLLGRTFPNAAYVVETADGLVLVDTCPEADAAPIVQQVANLGLDIQRLRRILLTHSHGDHSFGAEALRTLTGAKILAGRGDCAALRAGAPREALVSVWDMAGDPHPTTVDVELAGGEVLEQGGTRIRVIATPGHTPGSLCYLLERDGRRILFTGDTVASLTDGTPPLTGPGIYSCSLAPRYGGDAREFLATLRTLRAMPVPDLVLPGHPRADPEPASPRLSAAEWDGLLGRAAAKLETLLARHEKDGRDFLDGNAKDLLPGLRY